MAKEQACPMKKTSIGGQALVEGVMMRGPEKTVMAVRHVSGEMVVEEMENAVASRPAFTKWPFIRGLFGFVDSLRLGYKCLMRSAELSGLEDEENAPKTEEEEKKQHRLMNALMAVAAVLGVALSLVLFMWLPIQLFSWLVKAVPAMNSPYLRGLFEGVLRIVIFIVYLLLVTQMKDIRRTFQYHGAEHKSIFCYEKGLPLTVENVRAQSRFHPRCGTSFMILMLIVGVVISILIPITTPWLRTAIKLLLLPVSVGVGYELIKLAGRHDNVFTRIISAPGVWLQHLTTKEPEDGMIECAIASLEAVIPADSEADNW